MHLSDTGLIFSATDLSNFLACPHLILLDRQAALGGPKPPKFDDPGAEVLRARGLEHETAHLETLKAQGLSVARPEVAMELPSPDRWKARATATLEAMRAGADVIYQGCLFDGIWLGLPDFLRRIDAPSDLGAWSYEIEDTKLAREARGGALLQLCFYADLLEHMQGEAPQFVHIVLGGPDRRKESFHTAEYAAYYRSVKSRFTRRIEGFNGDLPYAPDPVPHCDLCAWKSRCDDERREADHLALVADITGKQRKALFDRGVTTVADLAELPLPIAPPMPRVSAASAKRIREQARIQVEGRSVGRPLYELLGPLVESEGLAAIPAPTRGDLFFDIEGDPYALGEGIEYLLGFVDTEGAYTSFWALNRDEEKAAFEGFIDFVMARLEEHPDFHIYHYHHYEPTHLKQLMGRHATREDELDRLLRGKVFVDLHRVVRQGLRASVESYSIKRLEPFYGFSRDVDLRDANHALAHFEAWLELGGGREDERKLLNAIEGYNRDDCLSTLRLRDWLEKLREELASREGRPAPRPATESPEPGEDASEERERLRTLEADLTGDVPADHEARSPDQQARWLLAQLLGWHRREDKSKWWEYFRCLELSDEELVEDGATLGGLVYEGVVDTIKKSHVHRYSFPPQDHGIKIDKSPIDPSTEGNSGVVVAIDDARNTIDLRRGIGSDVPHPRALIMKDIIANAELRQSLVRLAQATIRNGLSDDHSNRPAVDLLLCHPPRAGQTLGAELVVPGEDTLEGACRLVSRLDRSLLPIQGPPGSGKTFTGARVILRLLQKKKRIGITATSHKVIANLLDETCRAAREAGYEIRGIQKCEKNDRCASEEIPSTNNNAAVLAALTDGSAKLAAGTAWLWCREDMARSVDVLFIDEAGQYSLANALAVCQAAGSVVLLGDPQQLEQPQQGVHPPGTDVAALDHLVGGEPTIPPARGLFLSQTWRLHPSICAFTSEIFYGGRLKSREGLQQQEVRGPDSLNGSGLRLIPVEHSGNQIESKEEVEEIEKLVRCAIEAGTTWIDHLGVEHPLKWTDVLVVAPYNAQVSAIRTSLPQARVGTVDKFQGQEAPIVIYSMTTSSAEDAPRGMGFLYSGSRLNVATSRARCLTVIVTSPKVFVPDCRTSQQMKLANAFCRYQELSS